MRRDPDCQGGTPGHTAMFEEYFLKSRKMIVTNILTIPKEWLYAIFLNFIIIIIVSFFDVGTIQSEFK